MECRQAGWFDGGRFTLSESDEVTYGGVEDRVEADCM